MSLVWVDFKVIGMGGLQGHWKRVDFKVIENGWTSRSLVWVGMGLVYHHSKYKLNHIQHMIRK